ncbi:hypothetical protein DFH27DRAFT_599992 [Peziza echinospora]|nr:hypothetical protein DFH27DRAFT_599992 [Peziza echinospora]
MSTLAQLTTHSTTLLHLTHSPRRTTPPFPHLTITPPPLLPPTAALTPDELTLLNTWHDLALTTQRRLYAESYNELLTSGKLSTDDAGRTADLTSSSSSEIETLRKDVDALGLAARTREKVAMDAYIAKEVLNAVYGVRPTSDDFAYVKARTLRTLHTLHTSLTQQSTALHTHLASLRTTHQTLLTQTLSSTHTNRALTSHLLTLTTLLSAASTKSHIRDPALLALVEDAEAQLREARMRWEVARNVVQGVVVGSGVDWVRVEEGRVRELMLKAGEEVE